MPSWLAALAAVLVADAAAHGAAAQSPQAIAAAAAPLTRSAASVGILIEDEDSVIFEHRSHSNFVPASVRKLFASAVASECLGLQRQFTTELWLDGTNVILRGGGDPSLGGRYAFDRDAVFAPFIAALKQRHIRSIEGDLIADVSLFDRTVLPPGWKVGNLGGYDHAPVDALAFNENVVGVTVDDPDCTTAAVTTDPFFVPATSTIVCADRGESLIKVNEQNVVAVTGTISRSEPHYGPEIPAIGDPALYAAQAFRDALTRAGIPVRGVVRVSSARRTWRERIATIDSPPLYSLLAIVLKVSQNLYTEMIFKSLSAGKGEPATYSASLGVEREFLVNEPGVEPSEFRFADGCGLATDNLVSPAATVRLLRWMNAPARRNVFWSLLATPGEEGTLRKRLLKLAPRLRAKTGTLNGVNSLAGIIDRGKGRYRYFCIFVNNSMEESSTAAIDAVVEAAAAMP